MYARTRTRSWVLRIDRRFCNSPVGERVASSKKKKIREVRDVSFDSPYGDVVEARGKESEEARVEGYGKRPVAVMDSVRQRCPQEKTGENNLESDRRTNLQMRARRTTDELVFFKIFKIERAARRTEAGRTRRLPPSGEESREREASQRKRGRRKEWAGCDVELSSGTRKYGQAEEGRVEDGETRRGEARPVDDDGLTYVRGWTA